MKEAVRTGVFPEKTVDKEGFFSKLWPFGNKHEQEAEDGKPESGSNGAGASAPGAVSGGGDAAVSEQQQQIGKKLRVLQGLYEMGLITREEYEAKRKAVLDQL